MALRDFFRRKEQPDRVHFTDVGVTRTRKDGVRESINWDDLSEVGILTTDEGPFLEDVYFVLLSSDGKSGCSVPQGSEGADELLNRLQKLPGFDNKAVIDAMNSTSNARFICWKKPSC